MTGAKYGEETKKPLPPLGEETELQGGDRGKGYLEIREGVLKFRAFPRKEAEGKAWT